MTSFEIPEQPLVPPADFPVTPSLVNELMHRYSLSSLAVESLSVYVELAQPPKIRRALEMVSPVGVDLSEEVLTRASATSWCKGLHEQTTYWSSHNIQPSNLSVKGFYNASFLLVFGKILTVTRNDVQPMTVPPRFRGEFPDLFGQDETVQLDETLY